MYVYVYIYLWEWIKKTKIEHCEHIACYTYSDIHSLVVKYALCSPYGLCIIYHNYTLICCNRFHIIKQWWQSLYLLSIQTFAHLLNFLKHVRNLLNWIDKCCYRIHVLFVNVVNLYFECGKYICCWRFC